MTIAIERAAPEHIPELARICYDAFGALHDRHRVPRDFESAELAQMVVNMMVHRPDYAGFTAKADGRVVGSNFISFTDEVAAVGPITVDPECQSKGAGRALMDAVLGEARRRGVRHVRLMQEAVNTVSLSLYTALGFEWRDAIAIMQLAPAPDPEPAVRPFVEADLHAAEELALEHYGHSRRNEVASALRSGLPAFAHESKGVVTGYLIPGFFGHGFARTREAMVALLSDAARATPPMFHRVLVPLSESHLYRELLARGGRTVKVMNSMTVGPYLPPREAWIPSIGC